MKFEVLIPTYNRAASLRRLLASLRAVECPQDVALQIMVVDNGCTDETPEVVKGERAEPTSRPLMTIAEVRKGKAAALNRGLAESDGEIIAILDDDVVVDTRWLVEHVKAHRETHFDAVQGRTLPSRDTTDGRLADLTNLYEYNVLVVDHGEEFREIRGFAGTNVSFKRKVIDQVGCFDARLGPGAAGYSEDSEYSRRVRRAGFRIGYSPWAVAYHELDPGRIGRTYNRHAEYRKGLSRAIYRQESIAGRIVPGLIGNCLRYGMYRVTGNTEKAYRVEGRIMKSWGYLMGKLQRGTMRLSRGD